MLGVCGVYTRIDVNIPENKADGDAERAIRNEHYCTCHKYDVVDNQTPRQLFAEKVLARNEHVE